MRQNKGWGTADSKTKNGSISLAYNGDVTGDGTLFSKHRLVAVDIVSNGSYTDAPTIVFKNSEGSAVATSATGAAATVELDNPATKIVNVKVTADGSGYAVDDTISLTGGTGSGGALKPIFRPTVNKGDFIKIGNYEYLVKSVTSDTEINVSATDNRKISIGSGFKPLKDADGNAVTGASTITIDAAPDGGTTATAEFELQDGGVTGIKVTNAGSGYTSAPSVTFGGDGTGLVVGNLTVSLENGSVKEITINPATISVAAGASYNLSEKPQFVNNSFSTTAKTTDIYGISRAEVEVINNAIPDRMIDGKDQKGSGKIGTGWLLRQNEIAGRIKDIDGISAASAQRVEGNYIITDYTTGRNGKSAIFRIEVNKSGAALVTIINPGHGFVNNEVITVSNQVLGNSQATGNLTFNVNGIETKKSNEMLVSISPDAITGDADDDSEFRDS